MPNTTLPRWTRDQVRALAAIAKSADPRITVATTQPTRLDDRCYADVWLSDPAGKALVAIRVTVPYGEDRARVQPIAPLARAPKDGGVLPASTLPMWMRTCQDEAALHPGSEFVVRRALQLLDAHRRAA